jgi:hypothetical protein
MLSGSGSRRPSGDDLGTVWGLGTPLLARGAPRRESRRGRACPSLRDLGASIPASCPAVAGGPDLGSGLFGEADQDRAGAGAEHAGLYDDDEAAAPWSCRAPSCTPFPSSVVPRVGHLVQVVAGTEPMHALVDRIDAEHLDTIPPAVPNPSPTGRHRTLVPMPGAKLCRVTFGFRRSGVCNLVIGPA